MKSIRALASQFGLSRSTLLYYDRRGLLTPAYRTSSGHRLYSKEDETRLAKICQLRETGLSLDDIDAVLEPRATLRTPLAPALHQRLTQLNHEIAALRKQQQVVIALLQQTKSRRDARFMSKDRWVELLTACGFGPEDRARWHSAFERLTPEAHQDFLESLGLAASEIRDIRRRSRARKPAEPSVR